MAGKKERRQSVFRQLSLMGAGLMLVLFLAFLISNRQMQSVWREKTWNANQKLMAQVEDKMEEYYQLMSQVAAMTAYSPTIYTYFFQDPVGRVISMEDVNMVFSNTILLEENIAGIYLYDKRMSLVASMGKGTQEVERMGLVKDMKSELEYSSLFYFSDSNTPYYAIYFPIFNLNSNLYGQQLGMCILIMKPDKFLGILEGAQATDHTQVYLLDKNNRVLASKGAPETGWLEPGKMEDSPEYQVAAGSLPMGGWKIVSRLPTAELYGGRDGLARFHTGAYLLALSLMFCMIAFCYWRLAVPIREMDSFVKRVSYEPEARILARRQDEIGRVEESLNQMLDRIEEKNQEIQDARERAYQMESAEKQLQILAYRNQINPHFLYNTLDCIRAMALYHDEDEIAEITLALAKVFRFAVREGNIVRVEEELNYIKEYANIIEHRFRGRIQVVTEAEESVRQKPMVKLLLQPLIENAVFHGLEKKIEGGRVKASIKREGEGFLRFVIEDNGCGIGEQELEELQQRIKEWKKRAAGGQAAKKQAGESQEASPMSPESGTGGRPSRETATVSRESGTGGRTNWETATVSRESGTGGGTSWETATVSRESGTGGGTNWETATVSQGSGTGGGTNWETATVSRESGTGRREGQAGKSQSGIGLANICQRLGLFYGEQAFFQVESKEGAGTRVTMIIPENIEEGIT
ncbi:MAG: histidine kinase [Lachnospiraceae bacterium]|nr:histidine kinase [Lachnospiraceae bacterium]